jgi:hypothetical protein
MSNAAPTPAELWERAERLFDEAQARNAMYDELDVMYDADPPDDAPDGIKLVRASHFTNTVDLVMDLASQQELIIEVPLRSESEAAEREADEQEKFLREWLLHNDEQLKQNTTMELAYLATQRAVCIAKVLYYDKALQQDGEGYALAGAPIVCLVRDPRFCAWEVGVGGLTFVAERFERRASEIRSLYPDALADLDKWPDELDVEWTECWTPTHVAYYAAEQPIALAGGMVRAHGYGVVPYAIGVGRVTPRSTARYQPLMRSIAPTCRNLDVWYSILLTSGWAAITSAWNVFSDSYPIDGSKPLNTEPGATNFFNRGDAVQPLQRAPLPADFFQAGDRMQQQLQQATFPFAMFGQVEGQMAGYAINMLTQSGRRALAPIWHAIESCYESVFRLVALIGKRKLEPLIGDALPLVVAQGIPAEGEQRKRAARREIKFRFANVGDDWQCQVELGDPMPADEASNLRMAIESTQAGLLSKRTARSRYKLTENDTEEQERIYSERIVEQLAPIETVKLAQRRGYIPRKLQLPEGWKQLPDGNIVPDLGLLGQQPEQAPAEPPQGQGQMPPDMAAAMPEMPPEMLGAGPSAADLQGLSGQGQTMPTLDEMGGLPPEMLPGMA